MATVDSICFAIRVNGEWGTFFVRQGANDNITKTYWCELACHTTFGSVGYYWGSMGRPADQFLASVDRGYLLGKLWGARTEVFDGRKAEQDVRELIDRELSEHEITREVWEERGSALSDFSFGNEFDWHQFVIENDWLLTHLMEGGGPMGQAPNPQAEGFWHELWPEFIREFSAHANAARTAGIEGCRDA